MNQCLELDAGTCQDVPGERNLDVVLIDRESQIQQLQLTVIPIQQVASGSTVLPSTSHILPQAIESCTFLAVALRVLAIRLSDVILEGLNPVDLVSLLQRTREHR